MGAERQHWSTKYWTPENICANCGHARACHLGQPDLKGGKPQGDSGWCTLPKGSCIFQPCNCTAFIEPAEAPPMPSFVPYGTRVTTTKKDASEDWVDNERPSCRWGVKGHITGHSDSHGLCYEVQHEGGGFAWYNHDELVVDEIAGATTTQTATVTVIARRDGVEATQIEADVRFYHQDEPNQLAVRFRTHVPKGATLQVGWLVGRYRYTAEAEEHEPTEGHFDLAPGPNAWVIFLQHAPNTK